MTPVKYLFISSSANLPSQADIHDNSVTLFNAVNWCFAVAAGRDRCIPHYSTEIHVEKNAVIV